MSFSQKLRAAVAPKNLLNHPFYQSWNEGVLSNEILQQYAGQYFAHVSAFPRYVSATHSMCEDINDRKLLLENLNDEENNGTNHPELWMQFAEGLGCDREAVKNTAQWDETKALIQSFFTPARSSYAEGLAALYTYEHQVPEIAETKIRGLKNFYGVTDERGLQFFEVHKQADCWHREQCETLLDALPEADQEKALAAACNAADAMWNFLTGVQKHTGMSNMAAC
ncbi:MAG: CADD family putative folate metabolism protein [Alphaproteobacteria bacterium]